MLRLKIAKKPDYEKLTTVDEKELPVYYMKTVTKLDPKTIIRENDAPASRLQCSTKNSDLLTEDHQPGDNLEAIEDYLCGRLTTR